MTERELLTLDSADPFGEVLERALSPDVPQRRPRGHPRRGEEVGPNQRRGAPILAKIRAIHHAAARLVATGQKHVVVAAQLGVTPQSLLNWTHDPSFIELVSVYKAQFDEIEFDHRAKLAAFGSDCVDVLHERLLEDPTQFSNRELQEHAEFAFDRSIAPKLVTTTGVLSQDAPPRITIEFVQPSLSPNAQVVDGKIVDADAG